MRLSIPRRLATVAAALPLAASTVIGAAQTPASAAAAKIGPSAFGMHYLDFGGTHPYPAMPFGSIRLLGGNAITWSDLQPTPDTALDSSNPAVQRLDTMIHTYAGRGVQPLIVFGGTPAWAAHACPYGAWGIATCGPELTGAGSPWARYVHFLAARYHNVYFEMWNEPNLKNGWNDSVTRLAAMQSTAYNAIHGAATGDRLVSPTVAITSTSNPATRWLKTFLTSYGGRKFDVFGLHMYPSDQSARYGKGPEWSVAYLRNSIRPLLHNNGIEKPIWDTEANVGRYQYSPEGGCHWGTQVPCLSRAFTGTAGAAMVARLFVTQLSSGVQRIFWYAADDRAWGGTWMEQADYRSLTMAGDAEKVARKLLLGAVPYGCSIASGGGWTCRFHLATGKNMLVEWTTGRAFYTHGPRACTRLWTVTGATRGISARTRLHITSVPQYIVGSFKL